MCFLFYELQHHQVTVQKYDFWKLLSSNNLKVPSFIIKCSYVYIQCFLPKKSMICMLEVEQTCRIYTFLTKHLQNIFANWILKFENLWNLYCLHSCLNNESYSLSIILLRGVKEYGWQYSIFFLLSKKKSTLKDQNQKCVLVCLFNFTTF